MPRVIQPGGGWHRERHRLNSSTSLSQALSTKKNRAFFANYNGEFDGTADNNATTNHQTAARQRRQRQRRWWQRDCATLAAARRRRCGCGAQRDFGSAVAAARWLRRWRQRDIVTSAAAWRLRGGGGSGDLVWGVDQRIVACYENFTNLS